MCLNLEGSLVSPKTIHTSPLQTSAHSRSMAQPESVLAPTSRISCLAFQIRSVNSLKLGAQVAAANGQLLHRANGKCDRTSR
jgi:hypothetical protein